MLAPSPPSCFKFCSRAWPQVFSFVPWFVCLVLFWSYLSADIFSFPHGKIRSQGECRIAVQLPALQPFPSQSQHGAVNCTASDSRECNVAYPAWFFIPCLTFLIHHFPRIDDCFSWGSPPSHAFCNSLHRIKKTVRRTRRGMRTDRNQNGVVRH